MELTLGFTLPAAVVILCSIFFSGSYGSRLTCTESEISACLGSFEPYFEKGVEALADETDKYVDDACKKYFEASGCVPLFVYYCPTTLRHRLKELAAYKYACNAVDRTGNWPFMPVINDEKSNPIDESLSSVDRSTVVDNAIKASVAAGVTLFLILICVLADCASRWHIYRKVKQAMSAAKADQACLKNATLDDVSIDSRKA